MITVIDAKKRDWFIDVKEIWHYKDLFLALAYRDYKVRYAQTFLGFAWALIHPLATLIIFTLIFGKAINIDTNNVPYPLFAATGMLAWNYFAFVMGQAGNSIIGAQNMIKKIYFPRIIIPLSKAFVGLIDFSITFVFIIFIMLYYKVMPSANILFLPIFVLLAVIASLGVGIWMSALTIRYRDILHIIPFMVQFGLYATPIAYPAEMILNKLPSWLGFTYFLNPMAGITEAFRWCFLGGKLSIIHMSISIAVGMLLFISSLFYFKKVEKVMADIV